VPLAFLTSAGMPEREMTQPYVLQMALRDTLHVLKEDLIELTLGQHPIRAWMFCAKIIDKLFLELDVLWAYKASFDYGAMWYNWARKKCHYGAPRRDHLITPVRGQLRGGTGSVWKSHDGATGRATWDGG
jgi:hypothetical protein